MSNFRKLAGEDRDDNLGFLAPASAYSPDANISGRTASMMGAGLRILIIEDEMMIALMLEQMLQDLGHTVVTIATTPADAVAKIAADPHAIDAAALDVNLAGSRSSKVADALEAHKIPFIVMTGYEPEEIPEFAGHVIVHKPFLAEHFERAFQSLEFRHASGNSAEAWAARDAALGFMSKPCLISTIVKSVEIAQALAAGAASEELRVPAGLTLFKLSPEPSL